VPAVVKTSIRLSPEICKKLESEARKLSEIDGETVTVATLIRACIVEKFPLVSTRARREKAAPTTLLEEFSQLKEGHAQLVQDVQSLVQTLSEMFPLLATREQVEELTDGIAAVIRAVKEG
jgi:hypothetical protein